MLTSNIKVNYIFFSYFFVFIVIFSKSITKMEAILVLCTIIESFLKIRKGSIFYQCPYLVILYNNWSLWRMTKTIFIVSNDNVHCEWLIWRIGISDRFFSTFAAGQSNEYFSFNQILFAVSFKNSSNTCSIKNNGAAIS